MPALAPLTRGDARLSVLFIPATTHLMVDALFSPTPGATAAILNLTPQKDRPA